MGTKAQLIDAVDHLAQIVAALNTVLQLAENLTNLIFKSVRD
jgi:hypothetical protein